MLQTNLQQEELTQIIHSRLTEFISILSESSSTTDNITYIDTFINNLPTYCKVLPTNEIASVLLTPIKDAIPLMQKKTVIKFISTLLYILNNNTTLCHINDIQNILIQIVLMLFNKIYLNDTAIKFYVFNMIQYICYHNQHNRDTSIISTMLLKIIKIINLNNNFTNDERITHIISIFKLFEYMIPLYPITFIEGFIFTQLLTFAIDSDDAIREHVCKLLPTISHVISYNIHINKFRYLYNELSTDKSNTVRKEAALVLTHLMKDHIEKSIFSSDNDNTYYIDKYNSFTLDNDKQVQIASMQIFGEFILLLNRNEIDTKYLDLFKNTVDAYFFYQKQQKDDEELLIALVKNIPIILYRFGKECWESTICAIFTKLLKKKNENVVKAIVSIFGEVASLLDENKVIYDLLPLFNVCITSKDQQVKQLAKTQLRKVMSNVHQQETKQIYTYFIKGIVLFDEDEYNDESNRTKSGYVIKQVTMPIHHDNEKVELCDNIEIYYDVFDMGMIKEYFLRVCLLLNCDNKAYIRERSSKTLASVLIYLNNDTNVKTNSDNKIIVDVIMKAFALNLKAQKRKQFVYIMRYLLECKELYLEKIKLFMKCYMNETVKDVKIAFVRLLECILLQKEVKLNYLLTEYHFVKLIQEIKANEELNEIVMKYTNVKWDKIYLNINEDNDNKQQEVSGDENGVDFINENGMLILKNDYFNKMKALFNLDIS